MEDLARTTGAWRRLANDVCPRCSMRSARIRINPKYQEFLREMQNMIGLDVSPRDQVLSYKCPGCQGLIYFTHGDIVGE